MTRESWQTRLGFILAAVGSAVGLGNIWRFPWMTAQNGGSAFLLLYLAIVILIGVPGLLGELVIGRRARRNPVGALSSLSGSKHWRIVGLLSVVCALALLSFYSVVGGWILHYFVDSVTGAYFSAPGEYFNRISFGPTAAVFHVIFLGLTAAIVFGGVRRGIETATKIMMPTIAVLLVALASWAFTLPGSGTGLAFYLDFDLAYLQANFFDVLIAAAGQALFTLSLGAGTMVTYASYLGEDRSLPADGVSIAILNTAVGVLAGLVVFPLLFALDLPPGSGGQGAVFISIAGAFAQLPFSRVLAFGFFAVITLAALSSSISMLEIPVAYLVDEHGVSRQRATVGFTAVFVVTGTICALKPGIFGFVAGTLVNLLLTAGLVGFLLFTGWTLGVEAIDEFGKGAGSFVQSLGTPWLFAIGVPIPIFLLFTLVTGVLGVFGISLPVLWSVVLTGAIAVLSFVSLRRPQSVL